MVADEDHASFAADGASFVVGEYTFKITVQLNRNIYEKV